LISIKEFKIIREKLKYFSFSLTLAKHPIERKGIVIEFRNDLLSDQTSFLRILGDMEEIMNRMKIA